jgi:protein O-GlcNAc transferase
VALDPFPFTGSTTTFEALWMGVPVVTLAGEQMAGRWSASMLTALKLPELIAGSPDEYVRIAAGLVAAPEKLASLRAGLRSRVAASPLCNGKSRARQVERIYRSLWRRWCQDANN